MSDSDRILIVDDDVNLRKTLENLFKRGGVIAISFGSGQESIEWAKGDEVAVALVDLRLEDMSGLEVIRELKRFQPDIECILMTGHASQTSAIEAMNIGAYSYLEKPYNVPHLMLTIRRAIERRESVRALRASEERFSGIFRSSPDVMVLFDAESGRFTEVNQKWEALSGYSRDETIGRTAVELNLYADLSERQAALDIMQKQRSAQGFKLRLCTKFGQERLVSINGETVEINQGVCWLFTLRDITEQDRAETALRESEERFRTLAENLPGMVYRVVLGDRGKMQFFNAAVESLTGYKEDELKIGKICSIEPLILPEDRDKVVRIVETAIENRQAFDVEYRLRRKDGEIRYFAERGSVVEGADGKPLCIDGVIFDVTDRKQAEAALLESEDRYRQLYEAESDAILLIENADGNILEANTAASVLYGYSHDELLSMKNTDLSAEPDETQQMTQSMPLDIGHVVTIPSRHHRKRDGTVFPVEITGRFFTWQGRGVHIAAIRDISLRVKDEEALRESEERFTIFMENLPGSAFMKDENSTLLFANHYMWQKFDIEKRIGLRAHQYLPPDLANRIVTDDRKALAEGPQTIEETLRDRDGAPITFITHKFPIRRPGKPDLLGAVSIDITERKRAERALRESEERYQNLARISPVGIFRTDENGVTTYVNPKWCQISGLSVEEALGDGWLKAVHPEDRGNLSKGWQEATQLRKPSFSDYRFVRPDGTIAWVMGQAMPEMNSEGQIVGYVGTITDITERKRAEDALRRRTHEAEVLHEAAASLTSSLDLSQVLDSLLSQLAQVVLYDSAAVFLRQDEQLLAVAGRGLPFPERIIGQLFPAGNELFDAVRKTGRPQVISDVQKDPRFQNWGGTDYVRGWIGIPLIVGGELIGRLTIDSRKVNAYSETDAKLALAFANQAAAAIQNARLYERSQQEIAERKLAEEALRESEEKYRTIFEESFDGLFITSPLGKILDMNKKGIMMFGYDTKEEIQSLDLVKDVYANPEDRQRILAMVNALGSAEYEVDVKKKSGKTMTTHCSLSAVIDKAGVISSYRGIIRDITERKQAEAALKEYSEHLSLMVEERTHELRVAQEKLVRQERLAVLGQLAGGVGHELRNPLAVILNAVYYLRLVQPEADDKVRHYHGMIEQEAHTAEKIINDLLDFARIKVVDRERVAASELVQRVLERYPAPPWVTVTVELPPNLPPVFADPRQMEQVLGNLVVNACQAMPEGGMLTISAAAMDEMAAIAVLDTGIGISPENMSRLFEPLFTTKPRGIGLGLALSKKFVEANSGHIEVQSEPEKGSKFTIYLPLA